MEVVFVCGWVMGEGPYQMGVIGIGLYVVVVCACNGGKCAHGDVEECHAEQGDLGYVTVSVCRPWLHDTC